MDVFKKKEEEKPKEPIMEAPPIPEPDIKKHEHHLPEPPKPASMDIEPTEVNFQELLKRHMKKEDARIEANKVEKESPVKEEKPQEVKEPIPEKKSIEEHKEIDDSVTDEDFTIPDIEEEVFKKEGENKKEDEKVAEEKVSEESPSLLKQAPEDNVIEKIHEEQVRKEKPEGPVFMKIETLNDIKDELSGALNLFSDKKALGFSYEDFFMKNEKVYNLFKSRIEDIENKLIRVDKKVFR